MMFQTVRRKGVGLKRWKTLSLFSRSSPVINMHKTLWCSQYGWLYLFRLLILSLFLCFVFTDKGTGTTGSFAFHLWSYSLTFWDFVSIFFFKIKHSLTTLEHVLWASAHYRGALFHVLTSSEREDTFYCNLTGESTGMHTLKFYPLI